MVYALPSTNASIGAYRAVPNIAIVAIWWRTPLDLAIDERLNLQDRRNVGRSGLRKNYGVR